MSFSSSDNNQRIEQLFSKFAAFYGHLWRSQFKNEGFLDFAKKEWQEGLKHFSEPVFNKAVIACRDFFTLPPTLAQMIACCRQIKKQAEFFKREPEQANTNREVALLHLKQIKEQLTKN